MQLCTAVRSECIGCAYRVIYLTVEVVYLTGFLNPSPIATMIAFKQMIEQNKLLFMYHFICERVVFGCEEIGKSCNISRFYIYHAFPRPEGFCLLMCILRSQWNHHFIIGSHYVVCKRGGKGVFVPSLGLVCKTQNK